MSDTTNTSSPLIRGGLENNLKLLDKKYVGEWNTITLNTSSPEVFDKLNYDIEYDLSNYSGILFKVNFIAKDYQVSQRLDYVLRIFYTDTYYKTINVGSVNVHFDDGIIPFILFNLEDTGNAINLWLNRYSGTSYLANGLTVGISLKDCVKIQLGFTCYNNNVKPYTSVFAVQTH